MKFGQPNLVYLLWTVPGLILFYLWAWRRRKKAMEVFAERELLGELTTSLSVRKQKSKILLLLAAVLLVLVSLIRPQWGFHWEEVKRRGLDILIAIDTSRSMLAEDVKPNRLQRSKLAVRDLVKKVQGDRLGLIAFAGSAFLQCPLTVDYGGFLLSLDDLEVGTIPRGGTSVSGAVREAIKSYQGGQKKYKVLVLITDGEDHEGDPVKAAEEAKEAGIKIFAIGIGTREGELIPVTDEEGKRAFLKDREGRVVKSRLDETVLQKVALATGGSYIRATGAEFGLDLIYQEKLAKMEKRELAGKMRRRFEERFQFSLGLALLLLMVEPLINERKG